MPMVTAISGVLETVQTEHTAEAAMQRPHRSSTASENSTLTTG